MTPTARMLQLTIPLRLKLGLNNREHWRAAAKRIRTEKMIVELHLRGKALPPLPATITLLRIGKRRCDDDNVPGGFKAVRDQIAACYGVDDGSDQYQWVYKQAIGKEYGVRVDIQSLDQERGAGEATTKGNGES